MSLDNVVEYYQEERRTHEKRIAELEAELAEARAQNERLKANVSAAFEYCFPTTGRIRILSPEEAALRDEMTAALANAPAPAPETEACEDCNGKGYTRLPDGDSVCKYCGGSGVIVRLPEPGRNERTADSNPQEDR